MWGMTLRLSLIALALPVSAVAHTAADVPIKDGRPVFTDALRQHIADEFMAKRMELAKPGYKASPAPMLKKPVQVASSSPLFDLASLLTMSTFTAPSGNGLLMAASFAPFKPKVRYYWDSNYFYEESDGIPDRTRQPNLMVGITSWQQQVPLPASYFASTTNGTNNTGSLGYQQPNYWKIPLVPVPAASPISLTGNFLRGAVALGADGVAIFNPRNNTGQFSQAIGELDTYGGHCGLGDDYHYHIFPVHLIPILGNAKPIAWGLDGYPVYGYVEPDGSAQQALDVDGGHDHGTWGYHYHARGTFNAGTGTWTPASPYMMNAMHGTVVNFDSQIDPQPTASGLRASGTGGYTAVPVAGAAITAFKNPVALALSGGHLVENVGGVASDDSWLMRYTVSGTTYDICWQLNRSVNPRTMTITWRHPTSGTTTTTYNNSGSRITQYPMAGPSIARLPDTGQILNATATFGEDSDYTRNAPSFVDNGNGTISDVNTGLMWQKVGNGESTWETAVANASSITTGGYTDWRLPTPSELFSIQNHENNNPALNTTYFPSSVPAAEYWWTSDIFGSSTTNIWCANAGGGLGPKPKAETVSAGGAFQYHARYVRGAKPTNGHNYVNNGDGTITDLDTNLMWSQVPSSNRSWTAALTYAEDLALGGYSDWRMPNVKELQSLVDFARATATTATTTPCLNRTLFPSASATSYWSSSSQKSGTPTAAWVVEFGVTTTSNPPRNAQGIISYEPYASTYPTFAVRTVPAASTTQGRATTVTTNLFPAGQRVSGVGTITATDSTVWTVPAATQFTTTAKAPDLYNEYNAVTPANITAAQTAINALPTQVIDADGEVVTGYIFSDNYFELYVNGALVGVDPVPYTSFNSCMVKFKAKRPITYAVKLVDWEENLGLGTELNGGDSYHIGDGGFMASFSDGTVTNNQWKAQTFNISPLDNPSQVVDLVNGTHDSSAATTHTLTETAYALHYPVPSNWSSKSFGDGGWPAATTYTEAQVGINNIPAYTNFPAQFSASGAQFIWSSNLLLDNEVVVRYTGPAATPSQITVEQPTGTALIDGSSTVAYGSVNTGSTSTKTFTIRNNSSTSALSITGVTIDGTNAANFTVTTSPASSIAASSSTTMVVQFAPTTVGAKTSALHIASSDSSVGTAFDINLTGTGATTPPTITNVITTPTVPSNTDTPMISALITPTGATITSAALSYSTGTQATTTIFNEPMAIVATSGTGAWDQVTSPATYAWTLTNLDGAGNIKQTAGTSNHTTGITGSCGVVLGKGSASSTDPTRTMITLTNPINATGTFTSGSTTTNYVEFWVRTVGLTITNGWSFQLAPNGTSYTERLSEFTASVHGYQLYHYDLLATDLTSTLKMRFGFVGNGVGGPTGSSVNIDDIVVVTTSGSAPTNVSMSGSSSGGTFTATIPAQASGTTINYSISATDSNGQTTTITNAGSYTTGLAPSITTSATLPATAPGGSYSQTLAASGGSGSGYTWSVNAGSSLPAGLTLSGAGLLSGSIASTGNYSFTLRVTDSAGRITTRVFTLSVSTTTAPNVVIILTDDQGWADVGYHTPAGQVPIQTPNMDRFGTDGIRLEKFYPTTICAVTRGCLLTGRNSVRTGVGNQKGLNVVEHTMPQTFKAAGYQTFMCGKWHIGGWDNNIYTTTMNGATIEVQQEGFDYHPIARGWDFHKGQYGGAINYFTHTTSDPGRNNAVDWWQNNVQLLNDNTDLQGNGGYSTDLLADKAVELIQTRDTSKPMLLYLAFNAIHAGVSAPTSYLNKYSTLGLTGNRRTIAAAVDCMDVAMGRVLAALDTAGITNNTLVVFMSDNGGDTSTGSLNTPLRGTKSDSYDGGLHTPAGIRWPGRLAAGVTSNQYIWVGDMFPTICAAVGVTPQNMKPFDGVNLWPALQSITPAAPDGAPRGVPLVTGDAGGLIAMNLFTDPVNSGTKMFKLIRTPGTTVVNELFNLTDDPYETTDILLGANAAVHSTIVTTLTSAITGIVTENYPPNFGINGIAQTVVAGGNISLYAPFTSYKTAPTVQWKKGGSNVTNSTPFYQVTNSGGTNVAGIYMATLPLTNVSIADAGSYTATATNTTGNATTPAGTLTVVTAPVLNALAAYTAGTSRNITWPAVTGATGYTVQIATNSGFTTGLSSQTVATNTATFSGLTSGTLYYYRATSNYNATSTPYSNTVSSTQDATNPAVAITTSAGSTTRSSLQITGTASDAASGLASVTVNGVTATITSGTWSVTVPLNLGSNTVTATATDNVGNSATASISVTRTTSTQNDGLPDSWKIANNIPLTNAPANGPTGDIDGDGRKNLLEYAFNTNPQSNETDPVSAVPVTKAADGLQYLEVRYPRRIGALDLLYTVEISDDLTTWPSPGVTSETVSVIANPDGITENVTVRVLPAMTSAVKKFVRVRVAIQ